jgi:hypothetical protein
VKDFSASLDKSATIDAVSASIVAVLAHSNAVAHSPLQRSSFNAVERVG